MVTKIPRFDFVKFPQADDTLTTQMKSVGEAMSIGRTFQESLQKAMRSLEIGSHGFEPALGDLSGSARTDRLNAALRIPKADRLWFIGDAFREGMSIKQVHELTGIEPWFLAEVQDIIATESDVSASSLGAVDADQMFAWKRKGFSDVRLSQLLNTTEDELCLLYTSPSPRDQRGSRMPSSA